MIQAGQRGYVRPVELAREAKLTSLNRACRAQGIDRAARRYKVRKAKLKAKGSCS